MEPDPQVVCPGPPDDAVPGPGPPEPDDSTCAHCGRELPGLDPLPAESWPFHGFCDARCAIRSHFSRAAWPDDEEAGSVRREVARALDELIGPEPLAWFVAPLEGGCKCGIGAVSVGLTREAVDRLLGYRETLRALPRPDDLVELRVMLEMPVRWLATSPDLHARLKVVGAPALVDQAWREFVEVVPMGTTSINVSWVGPAWEMPVSDCGRVDMVWSARLPWSMIEPVGAA